MKPRLVLASLSVTLVWTVVILAPVRALAQHAEPPQTSDEPLSADDVLDDPCLPPSPAALGSRSGAWFPGEARAFVIRPIPPESAHGRSFLYARTELFFGTAKPDGVVSDEEFRAFLDDQIAPRFPDGLTLVRADGQFRGADGEVVKERSFVLILLYPLDDVREGGRRIERIRSCYKQQFQQESVLRVDDLLPSRVAF